MPVTPYPSGVAKAVVAGSRTTARAMAEHHRARFHARFRAHIIDATEGKVHYSTGRAIGATPGSWKVPSAIPAAYRRRDASISASASLRPTQLAPSTLLPGSRSL